MHWLPQVQVLGLGFALTLLEEVFWGNPLLEEVSRDNPMTKLALQLVELDGVVKEDPVLPFLLLAVS